MIEYTGPATEQTADVRFDRGEECLVVTINGRPLIRLGLDVGARLRLAQELDPRLKRGAADHREWKRL